MDRQQSYPDCVQGLWIMGDSGDPRAIIEIVQFKLRMIQNKS